MTWGCCVTLPQIIPTVFFVSYKIEEKREKIFFFIIYFFIHFNYFFNYFMFVYSPVTLIYFIR